LITYDHNKKYQLNNFYFSLLFSISETGRYNKKITTKKEKKSEKKMENNKKECPYCVKSKNHARRHGNDESYVVCLPHRVIEWVTGNAYNPRNVDMRNPTSADKYLISNDVYLRDGFEDIPKFGDFEVIASANPIYVNYPYYDKVVILFAVVIANIKDGEYRDRRFATIFRVDDKQGNCQWGILDDEESYLHQYIGFGNIESLIDTCVYGRAQKSELDNDIVLFTQRDKCSECK
jgi:hypothetical protein